MNTRRPFPCRCRWEAVTWQSGTTDTLCPLCPAPWGSATRSAQGRGAVLGGKRGQEGLGFLRSNLGFYGPPERMGNLHN